MDSVHGWQRLLGISLRPWSGQSPMSLIVRGAIHVAVCVFVLIFFVNIAGGAALDSATMAEVEYLKPIGLIASVVVIILMLVGVLRIVVGAIDLIPRKEITGTLVRVSERKFGDALPLLAQRALFERNEQSIDRRRERMEIVVDTSAGERQWTVRNRRILRDLRPGAEVRLTVSPLVGYVSAIETITRVL